MHIGYSFLFGPMCMRKVQCARVHTKKATIECYFRSAMKRGVRNALCETLRSPSSIHSIPPSFPLSPPPFSEGLFAGARQVYMEVPVAPLCSAAFEMQLLDDTGSADPGLYLKSRTRGQ